MIGDILRDDKNNIVSPPSAYNPSVEVKNLTNNILRDYQIGFLNLHKVFREFNDRSLPQVLDDNQKRFLQYIPFPSTDPDERWRFQGIKPKTRNKVISMAAHIIITLLYPQVFATNTDDEEDKKAAYVMRDLIEWNIRNSEYKTVFLYAIIAGLVNPAVILETECTEVMQQIRMKLETGNVEVKEVIDEVFSGLKVHLVPLEEFLIANPYQFFLQRQRFVIRRKFIDYDDAKALFGEHPNFQYITPGIKVVYDPAANTFYNVIQKEVKTLVEYVRYYNRREDTEVPFINGVYMGNQDTKYNPFSHRRITKTTDGDFITVPIYPFAKAGYEPIDEMRFFYYVSLVSKIGPDQDIYDKMWRMVMDGTFLQVIPPQVISGEETIVPSVVFPGAVTALAKDTKITSVAPQSNLAAAYNALGSMEKTFEESAQSDWRAGVSGRGGRITAYEMSLLQQEAKVNMSLFLNMVANLIVDYDHLMVDNIVRHQTVGDLEAVMGGDMRFKYRSFLLPNKTEQGKNITKHIKFVDTFLGKKYSGKQIKNHSYRLLEQEGGMDSEKRLIEVNPEVFWKLKYTVVFDIDTLQPKNEELERSMKLQFYDKAIQNPFVDQKELTRDFLVEPFAKGNTDKYIKDQANAVMPGLVPAPQGQNLANPPQGQPGSPQGLPTPIVGQFSLNDVLKR